MLVIDRSDDSVSHLFDAIHPTVLKLILDIIKITLKGRGNIDVWRDGRQYQGDAVAAWHGPAKFFTCLRLIFWLSSCMYLITALIRSRRLRPGIVALMARIRS